MLVSDLVKKNAIHDILYQSPREGLQQRLTKIRFTVIYALHVADAVDAVFRRTAVYPTPVIMMMLSEA